MFALAAPVAAFLSYFGLVRVRMLQLARITCLDYNLYNVPPLEALPSHKGFIIKFCVQVMYVVQLPLTGIAMLFSAGTFLYVSTVHVLNEITQGPPPRHSLPDHINSVSSTSNSKLSRIELFLLVFGALLPLVFNVFHSHGH